MTNNDHAQAVQEWRKEQVPQMLIQRENMLLSIISIEAAIAAIDPTALDGLASVTPVSPAVERAMRAADPRLAVDRDPGIVNGPVKKRRKSRGIPPVENDAEPLTGSIRDRSGRAEADEEGLMLDEPRRVHVYPAHKSTDPLPRNKALECESCEFACRAGTVMQHHASATHGRAALALELTPVPIPTEMIV